jgi:Ca2+-binding EF-hand superfamily protein
MSSSIGSVGNMSMFRMNRPDPSQMASKLFSKLDSSNQGYIEKSDLQSALNQISDSSGSSSSSTSSASSSSSVDDIFAKLDTDGDGKVTKDEFTSSLKKLSDELDNQFNNMRMNGFGGQQGGAMPPPPPDGGQRGGAGGQGGSDSGFTKDQLSSQLNEIGSSDSKRASLLSNVVNNFDSADSNGDGKVSFTEAMALQQSLDSANGTSSSSSTASTKGVGDAGFTKDELSSQLDEIGTSDSQRSALISNVLDNFDTADSDSDGKVSFKEAMALQQSLDSSSSSSSSSSSTSSDSSSSNSSSLASDAQLMKTIMQLAQAYGAFGQGQQQSNFASLLSTAV